MTTSLKKYFVDNPSRDYLMRNMNNQSTGPAVQIFFKLQGHVGGRNIPQGHRPALGAGGRLHCHRQADSSSTGPPAGWTTAVAGPRAARPRAVGATCAFKFESGRQRVLRSTIRGPPTRAVRLSDSVRLSAPGRRPARPCAPCARAVSIRDSKKEIPRATTYTHR